MSDWRRDSSSAAEARQAEQDGVCDVDWICASSNRPICSHKNNPRKVPWL
jgi:hypothetical protein